MRQILYSKRRKIHGNMLKGREGVTLSAKELEDVYDQQELDQSKLADRHNLEEIGQSSIRLQLPKSWHRSMPVLAMKSLVSISSPPVCNTQTKYLTPGAVDQERTPWIRGVKKLLGALEGGRGRKRADGNTITHQVHGYWMKKNWGTQTGMWRPTGGDCGIIWIIATCS